MKNKLAEIRILKNYSQNKLAELLYVSQQTFSSWETGRTIPKPHQMQHLEDILGVDKEVVFFKDFNYKIK